MTKKNIQVGLLPVEVQCGSPDIKRAFTYKNIHPAIAKILCNHFRNREIQSLMGSRFPHTVAEGDRIIHRQSPFDLASRKSVASLRKRESSPGMFYALRFTTVPRTQSPREIAALAPGLLPISGEFLFQGRDSVRNFLELVQ